MRPLLSGRGFVRQRFPISRNPRYFGRPLRKRVIKLMNQKRTRVPLPHPPPYRPSRTSYWLTVLFVVLIAFAIGASIWMLIDSWISGSITTTNRGPRSTYTLAEQPRRFWFEFVRQGVVMVLLLAIAVFGVWIYRKVQKPSKPANRKRRAKKT